MSKYDILKLENQMCFPLYAISREIIKLYNFIKQGKIEELLKRIANKKKVLKRE